MPYPAYAYCGIRIAISVAALIVHGGLMNFLKGFMLSRVKEASPMFKASPDFVSSKSLFFRILMNSGFGELIIQFHSSFSRRVFGKSLSPSPFFFGLKMFEKQKYLYPFASWRPSKTVPFNWL